MAEPTDGATPRLTSISEIEAEQQASGTTPKLEKVAEIFRDQNGMVGMRTFIEPHEAEPLIWVALNELVRENTVGKVREALKTAQENFAKAQEDKRRILVPTGVRLEGGRPA